jgi:hypothetical protein
MVKTSEFDYTNSELTGVGRRIQMEREEKIEQSKQIIGIEECQIQNTIFHQASSKIKELIWLPSFVSTNNSAEAGGTAEQKLIAPRALAGRHHQEPLRPPCSLPCR